MDTEIHRKETQWVLSAWGGSSGIRRMRLTGWKGEDEAHDGMNHWRVLLTGFDTEVRIFKRLSGGSHYTYTPKLSWEFYVF